MSESTIKLEEGYSEGKSVKLSSIKGRSYFKFYNGGKASGNLFHTDITGMDFNEVKGSHKRVWKIIDYANSDVVLYDVDILYTGHK